MVEEKKQDWYFTFGYWDALNTGCIVIISGTYESARKEMIKRYGSRWLCQHASGRNII